MCTLMKGVSGISRVFDDSGGCFSLKNIGEGQVRKRLTGDLFQWLQQCFKITVFSVLHQWTLVFSHRRRKHYCQVLNWLSFESVQHVTGAKKNTPPARETLYKFGILFRKWPGNQINLSGCLVSDQHVSTGKTVFPPKTFHTNFTASLNPTPPNA